jgi:polysaccharide biosynthesis protein PslH
MSKKLVLVLTCWPFPKTSGKKVVLGGVIEGMVSVLSADCIHCVIVDSDFMVDDAVNDLGVSVEKLTLPSAFRKIFNFTWESMILRRRSLQESAFWCESSVNFCSALQKNYKDATFLLDGIRIWQLFERAGGGGKRIFYGEDFLARRYLLLRRLWLRFPNLDINPLGDFTRRLPSYLVWVASFQAVRKALVGFELSLCFRRELMAIGSSDLSLYVNGLEVRQLKRISGRGSIAILPVRLAIARKINAAPHSDHVPFLLFVGLLSLPQNYLSLSAFIEAALPVFRKSAKPMHIHVVGAGASPSLTRLFSNCDDIVKYHGFIPDLSSLYDSALGILAPSILGGGVKLKVLEAAERGIPLVATPSAVEGLGFFDGKHGVIRLDLIALARGALDLNDNSVREAMGRSLYDWSRENARRLNFYHEFKRDYVEVAVE